MRLFTAAIPLLILSHCAFGQTYTIQTFAGRGLPVDLPGTAARLPFSNSIAVDAAGNVYFADASNTVLRLDAATGMLTLVAGTGVPGYSGDNGPAASAQLWSPAGLAVDGSGNLYIADAGNGRIRKVSNGVITTVDLGVIQGGNNGPPTIFPLGDPSGVAVDSAGNLYIADRDNARILRLSNGVTTVVAGNGTRSFSGDNGPAASAGLNWPQSIAVDSAGNLYITGANDNHIREVSNGMITTIAGIAAFGYSGDNGPAVSAQFSHPSGITVDSAGSLYIADLGNGCIRKISNGVITTVAGTGTPGFSGDNGPATAAQLNQPMDVTVDAAGNLYIVDSSNYRIRKVSNGVIATIAGNTTSPYTGDNGPATSAQLYGAPGVAVDSTGNLYIADSGNHSIRRVSNGVITTVAGNGTQGNSGDNGPATSAQLYGPSGVAVDSAGNLYIADGGNANIREVSSGVITTVAGTGTPGFSGDNGLATEAKLNQPLDVAVDAAGGLYIADAGNYRIRKVSNGVITTVAGTGDTTCRFVGSCYSGDNGPATSAQLADPSGVAVDAAGNLFIADTFNNRVRKVSNGVITTVAGGNYGYSGDNGPATSAGLSNPRRVAVDSAGNMYIADSLNLNFSTDARIRKVSNGVITTIAGTGTQGFSGDNGPATSAEFRAPSGVAVDSGGNVYIADVGNDRIRELLPAGPSCSAFVGPLTLSPAVTGGNLTVSIQTGPACAWAIQSLPAWIAFSGNAVGSGPGSVTLTVAPNPGAARTATVSVAGLSVAVSQSGVSALSIASAHAGAFAQGENGATYSLTVSNSAGVSETSGAVTVTETTPPGLTLMSMAGTGWTCPSGGNTCVRSDALAPGASYPTITVNASVATNASSPQVNVVSVFGGASAGASATDSTVVTFNLATTYMVGDIAPYTSARASNFGDGVLDILDLIQQLFAVNKIPGFVPAACLDRFDAMDAYPPDTASTRGGDGVLDIRDLILEMFRANSLDPARPVRASRGGVCPGGSGGNSISRTEVSRNAAAFVRPRVPAQGALRLGRAERSGGTGERVPIYLEAGRDLVRVAVTFALGDQQSSLSFEPTAEAPPSLVQYSQLGVVAAAWLDGVSVRAGDRLLLGYVAGPVDVSANLKIYGLSASGLDDNREVPLDAPAASGQGR